MSKMSGSMPTEAVVVQILKNFAILSDQEFRKHHRTVRMQSAPREILNDAE